MVKLDPRGLSVLKGLLVALALTVLMVWMAYQVFKDW